MHRQPQLGTELEAPRQGTPTKGSHPHPPPPLPCLGLMFPTPPGPTGTAQLDPTGCKRREHSARSFSGREATALSSTTGSLGCLEEEGFK